MAGRAFLRLASLQRRLCRASERDAAAASAAAAAMLGDPSYSSTSRRPTPTPMPTQTPTQTPPSRPFASQAAAAAATPATTPAAPPRQHGSKVSLPADDDVLRELVVVPPDGAAAARAIVGVRAYHCGGRLRVGALAALARAKGLRTLQGADYCLVWLAPRGGGGTGRQAAAAPADGAGAGGGGARDGLSEPAPGPPPLPTTAGGPFLLAAYRHGGVALFGGSRRHDQAALLELPLDPSVVCGAGGADGDPAAPSSSGSSGSRSSVSAGHTATTAAPPARPPGALGLLTEEYALHVDPRAPRFAQRLPDALLLRRLDVGAARVVSSVLAQSVSLDASRRAVDAYLDGFQRAKRRAAEAAAAAAATTTSAAAAAAEAAAAAGAAAAAPFSSPRRRPAAALPAAQPPAAAAGSALASLVRAVLPRGALPGGLDTLLVRATASGALAAADARGLLDICEPAWKRDDFFELWQAVEAEFELERRARALERVISRQDDEARIDLAQRHGRRYHQLERAVIVLLGCSCAIKLVELGMEVAAGVGGRGGG